MTGDSILAHEVRGPDGGPGGNAAEPLLIEGGMRTLERLAPDLLLEVSPVDLKAFGCAPADLVGTLADLGYRLFDLEGGRLVPRAVGSIGPEFAAGWVPLCLLGVAQLVKSGFGPAVFLLGLTGHQDVSARVLGASAGINVALNVAPTT